ncbi:MAG: hypothetical protein Q9203_002590 [Teloschistes exilis]
MTWFIQANPCDEATPRCSYCQKKQVPCHRPKSQFDLAWRDQNAVATNAVQRRLNANDKARRDQDANTDLVKREDQVPRVIPQDFENYALNFFFGSYGRLAESSDRCGYLGCLYPVWTRTAPTSPLRPAVNAVALALLEAWSWSNPNSPQSLARPHYVQGIAAIRRRLQRGEDIDDDDLLATLILDMYDGIISFCGARPHDGPHIAGSRALLESRQRHPCTTETSQRVLNGARNMIISRALGQKDPVPENVLVGITNAQDRQSTSESELEEIQFEVANLQASAARIMATSEDKDASALDILTKCNELDRRLMSWSSSIPPEWVPTCIWDPESIPQSVRNAGLYQRHCTVHRNIFIANVLNGHCCSRIRVYFTMLACLGHLQNPIFEMNRTIARNTIQDLVDTICASVPYHLGDRVSPQRLGDKTMQYPRVGASPIADEHYSTAACFGGMFLAKRLAELLQPGLPLRNGQREWILSQMGRIKRIYLATAQN